MLLFENNLIVNFSGTTGLPKGVCLSHENIISNLYQLEEVDGMAIPCESTFITPLPFFHIFAFSLSAMVSLLNSIMMNLMVFSGVHGGHNN